MSGGDAARRYGARPGAAVGANLEACARARREWIAGFGRSATVRVHATVAACTDAEWEARRLLAAALVLRRAVGDDAGRMVAALLDA